MTVDAAIQKAFLHAQRKAVPPAAGTPKYLALLGIADSMQKLWASEPGITWGSLYSTVTLATLASAIDTFPLSATIDNLSTREGDTVRIVNGTVTKSFPIIDGNQLYAYRYQDAVARQGANLKFTKALSTTLTGGSILVPCTVFVADITDGSQTVAVDDPMYLVYMMAAEFVRNDAVRTGQYNNILALADQVMQKMKQANGGELEEVVTPWQPAGMDW